MAKLLNETYEIIKKVGVESVTIKVVIDHEDQVTIHTYDDKAQLVFTRSKADRVKAMGLAFQEAAELVESRKNKEA